MLHGILCPMIQQKTLAMKLIQLSINWLRNLYFGLLFYFREKADIRLCWWLSQHLFLLFFSFSQAIFLKTFLYFYTYCTSSYIMFVQWQHKWKKMYILDKNSISEEIIFLLNNQLHILL